MVESPLPPRSPPPAQFGTRLAVESLVPLHHAVRRRLQVFDVDDRPQRVVADGWERLADKLGELVRGDLSEGRLGFPPLDSRPVVGETDADAADVDVQGAHFGEQLLDAGLLGAVGLGRESNRVRQRNQAVVFLLRQRGDNLLQLVNLVLFVIGKPVNQPCPLGRCVHEHHGAELGLGGRALALRLHCGFPKKRLMLSRGFFNVLPFPQAHCRLRLIGKVEDLVPARGGEFLLKRPGALHALGALGDLGRDAALARWGGKLLAGVRRLPPVLEEVGGKLESHGVLGRPSRVGPARGEHVLEELAELLGGNLELVGNLLGAAGVHAPEVRVHARLNVGEIREGGEPVHDLLHRHAGGAVNLGRELVAELHDVLEVLLRDGRGVGHQLLEDAPGSRGETRGDLSEDLLRVDGFSEGSRLVRNLLVVDPVRVRRLELLLDAVGHALHAGDVLIRPVGPVTNRDHGVDDKLGESIDGHLAGFGVALARVDALEVHVETGLDVVGAGEVGQLRHELVEGRLGGTVASDLELAGEIEHLAVVGLLDVRDGLQHLIEVLAGLRGQLVDELRPDAGRIVDLAERRVLLAGVHGAKSHRRSVGIRRLPAHSRPGSRGGALLGAGGDDAHLGNLGV
mmetsp:Transcript_11079/g.46194  ORF Transcript_11079/g.46194 Transcript_11079/m.46194 type:complete len:626 (-) Transcript_11079:1719-3596(-)